MVKSEVASLLVPSQLSACDSYLLATVVDCHALVDVWLVMACYHVVVMARHLWLATATTIHPLASCNHLDRGKSK
jgi:hypothetical protein